MTDSISRLTRTDTFNLSDILAVSQNGQDVGVPGQVVADAIKSELTSTSEILQYSSPSTNGLTTTLTDSSSNLWLVLTPTGTLSTHSVKLPAVANCVQGQEITVNCTQVVGTLTIDSNGSGLTGAPSTLAANGFFKLKWEPFAKVWYRVG